MPLALAELARQTASRAKLVVMIREPRAAVTSAHFRRHLWDQAFETTASDLYAHFGLIAVWEFTEHHV